MNIWLVWWLLLISWFFCYFPVFYYNYIFICTVWLFIYNIRFLILSPDFRTPFNRAHETIESIQKRLYTFHICTTSHTRQIEEAHTHTHNISTQMIQICHLKIKYDWNWLEITFFGGNIKRNKFEFNKFFESLSYVSIYTYINTHQFFYLFRFILLLHYALMFEWFFYSL